MMDNSYYTGATLIRSSKNGNKFYPNGNHWKNSSSLSLPSTPVGHSQFTFGGFTGPPLLMTNGHQHQSQFHQHQHQQTQNVNHGNNDGSGGGKNLKLNLFSGAPLIRSNSTDSNKYGPINNHNHLQHQQHQHQHQPACHTSSLNLNQPVCCFQPIYFLPPPPPPPQQQQQQKNGPTALMPLSNVRIPTPPNSNGLQPPPPLGIQGPPPYQPQQPPTTKNNSISPQQNLKMPSSVSPNHQQKIVLKNNNNSNSGGNKRKNYKQQQQQSHNLNQNNKSNGNFMNNGNGNGYKNDQFLSPPQTPLAKKFFNNSSINIEKPLPLLDTSFGENLNINFGNSNGITNNNNDKTVAEIENSSRLMNFYFYDEHWRPINENGNGDTTTTKYSPWDNNNNDSMINLNSINLNHQSSPMIKVNDFKNDLDESIILEEDEERNSFHPVSPFGISVSDSSFSDCSSSFGSVSTSSSVNSSPPHTPVNKKATSSVGQSKDLNVEAQIVTLANGHRDLEIRLCYITS